MTTAACQTTFIDLLSCYYASASEDFNAVDWTSEAKYLSAAIFTTAFIVAPLIYVSTHISPPIWFISFLDKVPELTPQWLKNFLHKCCSFDPGTYRLGRLVGFPSPRPTRPRRIYDTPRVIYTPSKDFTRRISFTTHITLFAYPSKGGVIILSPAYAADFDALNVSRMNPPALRFDTQDAEDEFCKSMLLLGAKWWDSLSRYYLITGAQEGEEDCKEALENDETVPQPTIRERLWCSVAWPSIGDGFVIAEYHDTRLAFRSDGTSEYEVPADIARLGMCRNMDERATMLKERFEGKSFASVEDYVKEGGDAFLGAWEWKGDRSGEVGVMEKAW